MIDLLLPATDAGVAAQAIAATIVFAAATWWTRKNSDVRLVVIGLWLVAYGAMGVRALH